MNRVVNLTTLFAERLRFLSLQGSEQLSALFEYRIQAVCEDSPIEQSQLPGTDVTIEIDTGAQPRYLNGVVREVRLVSEKLVNEKKYFIYELFVVPQLWYSTQAKNSRIYQEMSALDVVREVLESYDLLIEEKLIESYRKWTYCVQYDETDFAFISRLLEHEGIYYWFRHEEGKHYLVLSDYKESHPKLPVNSTAFYYAEDEMVYAKEQHIFDWQPGGQLTANSYATQDYNFENPRADLSGFSSRLTQKTGMDLTVYEPFGGYVSADESAHYARVHLESIQALQDFAEARTRLRDLAPGYIMTLQNAPFPNDNGDYLVIKVTYDIVMESYVSGADEQYYFEIAATYIPKDTQFRAPRIHQEPKMGGPQTAVVTGPAGEEIWTDKYGRIKVQFHWDRDGQLDENSSCWVRVSSPWAGSGFGGVQIPRVGEEVVVDFVDGQPDRPVVIGRVYNNLNMPPVNLPDDATQSGFFTRSKNGDASNANRLMFDDRPGEEMLSFIAERDMNTLVKDKQTQKIVGNVVSAIAGYRSHTAHSTSDVVLHSGGQARYESDHQRTIDTQLTESIGGNLQEDYLDGVDETITGTFDSTVSGAATHTVQGYHLNTQALDDEEVNGSVEQTIGASETVTIKSSSSLQTASLDWSTPRLNTNAEVSDTKLQSDGNINICSASEVTQQASGQLSRKSSLAFKGHLSYQNMTVSHQKDVPFSLTFTGAKETLAANAFSRNIVDIGLSANARSNQFVAANVMGVNLQLVGHESKSGISSTELVGILYKKGFKKWLNGAGPAFVSAMQSLRNKMGGGKGGKGGKNSGRGRKKKPEKAPNRCKSCRNLSRSQIMAGGAIAAAAGVGMAVAASVNSIDFALGDESFTHVDFSLPGVMPIVWARQYRSNCYAYDEEGALSALGPRWNTPLLQYIYLEEGVPTLVSNEGRLTTCPQALPLQQEIYDRKEELFWSQPAPDRLQVRAKDHSTLLFLQMGSVYRLTQLQDAQGNTLKLYYDERARLLRIESDLYTVHFRYTEQDRIKDIFYYETDAASGRKREQVLASYRYDEEGNLIEATDRYGLSNRYQYQAHHLITRYEDKTGRGVNLAWIMDGEIGRCVHEACDDGSEALSLRYDRENLSTYVTDALGQTTKYVFNAENYLMSIAYCDGTTRINERDEFNNITQVKYQDGTVSRFIYDAFDNLIEVVQPDGTRIRYGYDTDNHLILLEEPNGSQWHRAYNAQHLVEAETDPLGHVTRYQYNSKGQIIRIEDAKGGNKHVGYHVTGDVAWFRDCSGKMTKWDYDFLGRLIKLTEASGTTEEYSYDRYGELAKVARSGVNPIYLEHDAEGRLLKFIDGLDRETAYRYNPAGRVQARIDALNHTVNYRYDPLGRLAELVNENDDSYRFTYDPLGRLVHERAFDGKEKQYHINKQTGRLEGVTFEDQSIAYEYDVMGQLTKVLSADEVREFAYDVNGRLVLAKNPHSLNRFIHDALGNVVEETHQYDVFDHQVTKQWRYQYDELSNLICTLRPDGREVDYLRYGSGHLHGMLLDKERLIDVERDNNHREIARHWAQTMLQTTIYDEAGRLAQQHIQSGQYVKQSILQRDYHYDGANQLTGIKDSRKGELSYQYDPLGRLLKANGPLGEERFSFDPAHNLLSKSDAQSSHYTPDNTLPSGVSKVVGNLLKRISGYHFDYDVRGNLTRKESHKGIQTFSWDAHNQLTRSTSFSSATEPKLCTDYLYDVFGRRIAKRVVDEHRHTVIEQTLYDWEGLTIASEERIGQQLGKHAANPGRDWQNAPALALNVQYLYEDGQFVPLVQYINSSDGQAELLSSRVWQAELAEETQAAPKLYHYVCDHLGTPQLLMNQGQDVVWEGKAKAWGETRVIRRPATDEQVINNHRFQGQYYDAETSLHYNTFRYYDPELGRFISQDPIGLMGGINLYQYAPNPVEWVDPLGWKRLSIFNGRRGVLKAIHDLERNGYAVIAEEVTMKVNNSRIRADIVASDGNGGIHVFEVKHGEGRLTKNQKKAKVFDMDSPSNTCERGGGSLRPSQGRDSDFILDTRNRRGLGNKGQKFKDTAFHILKYR
ncbi:Cell wall-associated polypeptide CWBP200 [Oligella urethralis]|uniref:type VI secretion system tip protein TssI/VgrG n=1 Tax=Oligella urethralis TaxID=90245 RepID=UPI000DF97E8B|nr:Cell wall-associated polypeptide CWBP200 [Oligella urethralis]